MRLMLVYSLLPLRNSVATLFNTLLATLMNSKLVFVIIFWDIPHLSTSLHALVNSLSCYLCLQIMSVYLSESYRIHRLSYALFACWDAFRFNMLDNVTLDKYRLNHITDVLIRVSRETICYQTQANYFSFAFLRRYVFALLCFT